MLRKKVFVFTVLAVGLLLPAFLRSQIDNLSNMSAEWIRTGNRNAATDATDIVVYNPAGLIKLADGFHLNLSNQSLFRKPQHHFDSPIFGSGTYKQDSADFYLPNFYAAYKKGNWALFGGVYIPGGGAVADYPDGSLTTHLIAIPMIASAGVFDGYKDDYLEASSLYLTYTLGGAVKINNYLSLAVAGRYITAKNTFKTGLTMLSSVLPVSQMPFDLEAKDTAAGFGAVFGLNFTPMDRLNIGIRYETKVSLEFETEVSRDDFAGALVQDGDKRQRDFPAMFGIGAAYRFCEKLTLELDFNYYFQEQADWDEVPLSTGPTQYADMAGDCYGLGGALLYRVNPKFLVSAGLIYTRFQFNDMDGYYTNLGAVEVQYYDNVNVGAGLAYEIAPGVKLNLGLSYNNWDDPQVIQVLAAFPFVFPVELKNGGMAVAIGLDIAF